jgi:hypothetical protein
MNTLSFLHPKNAFSSLLLVSLGIAVTAAVACGKPEIVLPMDQPPGKDAGMDGMAQPDGPYLDVQENDGQQPTGEAFEIVPADQVIDPVQPGDTIQFQAVSIATGEPVEVSFWYVDKLVAGSIDAHGLFTATGVAGGQLFVGAQTAKHQAATTLTLRVSIRDNPGGLDPATQAALEAGEAGAPVGNVPDGAFEWLYPYDATVFPRGLLPPTLQLAGQGADGFYLHVQSQWYEYQGFYAGSSPERLPVPETVWQGLTWSAGAPDPVQVQITKIQGGNVTGPVEESWTIAQGSLKGLVYYNTYDDPIATQGGQLEESRRGAVLRIRPGEKKPDVLLGGDGSCTVCHSVSANGSRMALSSGHFCNKAFDLSPSGGPADEVYTDDCSNPDRHDDTNSFGGLTPDGSLMLTSGSMQREPGGYDFFPNIASVDDDTGPRDSKLVDPGTGAIVPAPGFDGVVHKALMPSFAPDASKVAFVHYEAGLGNTLSVMDFDMATHTFSNLRVVYDVTQYGIDDLYAGWPAFTPDGNAVVYQVGDRPDYSTWRGGLGQLFIVDVASQDERALGVLNGTLNGSPYVGGPDDAEMSFEPTVLPVAVGGYYWVVFTSRRPYGNLITESGEGPDAPTAQHPSPKKLWVAAIDIGYHAGGPDPSHPAFYLEGQDLVSGNMRGFWALEPCRQLEETCGAGSDCCEGFCRAVEQEGETTFVCVPPPEDTCAEEYEKCTTAADCCDVADGYLCINGFCARPTPVK